MAADVVGSAAVASIALLDYIAQLDRLGDAQGNFTGRRHACNYV